MSLKHERSSIPRPRPVFTCWGTSSSVHEQPTMRFSRLEESRIHGVGMNRSGLTRGFDRNGFVDLPSSEDEVRIAQAAFPKEESKLLLGTSATEAAFKGGGIGPNTASFISLFMGLRTPHFQIERLWFC